VRAVVAARASSATDEAFWEEKVSNRAYRQLISTAHEGRADLRAGFALGEVLYEYASKVWEQGEDDEASAAARLGDTILKLVEQLSASAWLAVTALENRFGGFPEHTVLDNIAILNLRDANPERARELLDRFELVLVDTLGFPRRGSTTATQSYYDLDEHYFNNKTGGFIPTRPMVVFRLGSASELDASVFFNWSLRASLPLLLLCQLAYDLRHPERLRVLRTHDPLVNAFTVDSDSLVALPNVAIGLNTATGASAVWHRPFPLFEEFHSGNYDPAAFTRLWSEIASPFLQARERGIPPKLMAVFERCVRFVSECRHRPHDEVALHSVIATESLLSPFQQPENIAERFRAFGAALIAGDGPGRIEAYTRLGKLYSYRSKLVHAAGHNAELEEGEAQFAFDTFLTCLREVSAWAARQAEAGASCDAESFKTFFLERLFGGG
jgi:hypothetical protein